MSQQVTAGTIIPNTIGKYPSLCNVKVSYSDFGWRFESLNANFRAFTVKMSLADWDSNQGKLTFHDQQAVFPDTAARFFFDSGSILLVYASGHIRWITGEGLKYYAKLSCGAAPAFTQGDLVLFELKNELPANQYRMLEAMLPEDQSTVWCRASAAKPVEQSSVWYTVDDIALGGNTRHKAVGRMRVSRPIDGECRTVRVDTLSTVQITHDPVDAIHPTVRLDLGQRYLITKLPGFSDPLREMKSCNEVQP